MLLLINNIIAVLFALILIFVVIILSKQVTIWFYAHNERILIFQLHGASIIYSAAPVIKSAIYGAIFSFIIASISFVLAASNLEVILPNELTSILFTKIDYNIELIKMFVLSFAISVLTVFGVLFRYKIKNA